MCFRNLFHTGAYLSYSRCGLDELRSGYNDIVVIILTV